MRARPEAWRRVVLAALVAAVSLRAFELRWAGMTRPFWEDEVHHNYAILATSGWGAMREAIAAQNQPILEYAIRRAFWVPVLGHDERALRLPALAMSLLTPAAGAFVAHRVLAVAAGAGGLPWLGAALAGGWLAGHSVEVRLGVEARHYALVALASVGWFALWVWGGRVRAPVFFAASLAFANLHFFALPLVLAGFGLRALDAAPGRRGAAWVSATGQALVLLALTIIVNRPAWHAMTLGTPGGQPADLLYGLTGAGAVWRGLAEYLAFPAPVWLLWIGLALAARRDPAARRIVLVAFVVLPAFFVVARMKSMHTFNDRYYAPFLGLGLVTLVAALARGGAMLAAWRPRRRHVGWLAAAVLLLAFRIPSHAAALGPDALRLTPAPRNFSPWFAAFEELKRQGAPLLVLHNHRWADNIPLLYLGYLGAPATKPYAVLDAVGCLVPPARVRRVIAETLRAEPATVIVLDQKEHACEGPGRPLAGVRRVADAPVCIWMVRGAASPAGVGAIARAVGFQHDPAVFGR